MLLHQLSYYRISFSNYHIEQITLVTIYVCHLK